MTEKDSQIFKLRLIDKEQLMDWLLTLSDDYKEWVKSSGFEAKKGQWFLAPPGMGIGNNNIIIAAIEDPKNPWDWSLLCRELSSTLKNCRFCFEGSLPKDILEIAYLGWGLENYRYDPKSQDFPITDQRISLEISDHQACQLSNILVRSCTLTRDLINRPANKVNPQTLAEEAKLLAENLGAKVEITDNMETVKREFPLLWTVGRGAEISPRMIDIRWTPKQAPSVCPKITLVGKGICFDTGGLDIKPSNNMLMMRKDMGGAANVLGLMFAIISAQLNVELRVLIPAAENAISDRAYRPSDVLISRKGLSVEVGNTDAEGRLVLADALALASEEKPDMIIDFATLTGAARVAVGTELPAFFTHDPKRAAQLCNAGQDWFDPVWPLPLFKNYRRHLDTKAADINSTGPSGYGGAITAALFLNEFVGEGIEWLHFDHMGWNNSSQPGRPEGGEAQGLRAAFGLISSIAKGHCE